MTSFGAVREYNDEDKDWMLTFKVQGQVYRLTGQLHPVGLAQYCVQIHSCVFTCKRDQAVAARRAESRGRRPII